MEATVVCVDNSEWTRNGDYIPDRFQAQADAVNLLAGAKTQANAESAVGVLTMAGRAPRMLVTPTPDLSRVLNCMAQISVEGEAVNFSASVQIAQLALKHRPNKNQRQRIVIFAGSPLTEDKDHLVKTAKKLKKNNVAVDIVSFGCDEENNAKLQAFHNAVQSSDNSHYVVVPTSVVLSDHLIETPVFQGEGAAFGGAGPSADGESFEFGVDPNLDPELALALRVSMEEERARQNRAAEEATAKTGGGEGSGAEAAKESGAKDGEKATGDDMDEDDPELLQKALAISMQAMGGEGASTAQGSGEGDVTMVDDPDLALALQMSMQDAEESGKGGIDQVVKDGDYVNQVLSGLPGVNPDDPMVKNAVANLQGKKDDEKDDSKKDGKDKKDG
ncbi:hypothetical protein BSKO_11364 [Bryopsis sp. KO-2023]|nr:hypothetical protein BSKO_11364 [Bryopsis sp. KO-2023]